MTGEVVVMITVWSDGTVTAENPQGHRSGRWYPIIRAKDMPTMLIRLTKVTNQRKLGLVR